MKIKKQDAGVWVKASEEPLPKLEDRKYLHIKYKGKPELLVYMDNIWYWAGESFAESRAYPLAKDSISAIEWLKPVTGYLLTEDELVKLLHAHLDDDIWQSPEEFIRSITNQ